MVHDAAAQIVTIFAKPWPVDGAVEAAEGEAAEGLSEGELSVSFDELSGSSKDLWRGFQRVLKDPWMGKDHLQR